VRREHVAGLVPVRRLAADRVDPVHRDHREDVCTGAVTDADLVFVARLAHDVIAALMVMDRQRAVLRTVVDRHVRDVAHRGGRARDAP